MVRLSLEITPELMSVLEDRATRQGVSPEFLAARLLVQQEAATRGLKDGTRTLIVAGPQLEGLESILGGGSLLNGPDLLKKVQRLAGISFLHCRLPFTPNQLEELQQKAERNSLTVAQLVERTAPRIYEQFFDLVART